MLRQPAALAAKKCAEKQAEWERLQEQRIELAKDIEDKEVLAKASRSDDSWSKSDPGLFIYFGVLCRK